MNESNLDAVESDLWPTNHTVWTKEREKTAQARRKTCNPLLWLGHILVTWTCCSWDQLRHICLLTWGGRNFQTDFGTFFFCSPKFVVTSSFAVNPHASWYKVNTASTKKTNEKLVQQYRSLCSVQLLSKLYTCIYTRVNFLQTILMTSEKGEGGAGFSDLLNRSLFSASIRGVL